jgi:dihydroorotase
MPNTKPPITTVPLAIAYHDELMAARKEGEGEMMEIVNVLYLTDNTTVETVDEMAKHGKE